MKSTHLETPNKASKSESRPKRLSVKSNRTKNLFKTYSKDSASKKRKPRKSLEEQTVSQLRRVADDWFSWYVRLRDSDFIDDGWYGGCITCSKHGLVAYLDGETAKKRPTGAVRYSIGWDNGHFVGRSNLVLRFDEENNNLQCSYRCNNMRSGEHEKYRIALRLKYGDEIPEKLEKLAEQTQYYKLTRQELLQVIYDSKAYIQEYLKYAQSHQHTS